MSFRRKFFSSVAVLSLLLLVSRGWAAPEFTPVFESLNFKQPVQITYAPGDDSQLFVVEQGGTIQVFDAKLDVKQSREFFDVRKHSSNLFLSGGEQGLLGLAFDPDFADNGYFYLNYTANKPRRTVISRFQLTSDSSGRYQFGGERILLEINQDYSNHNGGMITFGPDGYLYIGMGDGGSGGDPNHRAQDGQSLLGKMLRITRTGDIPADNPFVDVADIRDEIWAFGLRNPWRFSFDRKTGALWAGDVGQNAVEEVDVIVKGGNYGWRWYEGSQAFKPDAQSKNATLIPPVFEYGRDLGQSITGGYVYRGDEFPALQGLYFFADFVSGRVWAMPTDGGDVVTVPSLPNPSGFGEDANGELYALSYAGKVYKLVDR